MSVITCHHGYSHNNYDNFIFIIDLQLHDIAWWIVLLVSLSVGVTVAIVIRLFVTKRLRTWVLSMS